MDQKQSDKRRKSPLEKMDMDLEREIEEETKKSQDKDDDGTWEYTDPELRALEKTKEEAPPVKNHVFTIPKLDVVYLGEKSGSASSRSTGMNPIGSRNVNPPKSFDVTRHESRGRTRPWSRAGPSGFHRGPWRNSERSLDLGKRKKGDGRPATTHLVNSQGQLMVRLENMESFEGMPVREMMKQVSNCPTCYKVFPPYLPDDEILCSRCWEKGHEPRRCPAPAPVAQEEKVDLASVTQEEKLAMARILLEMRKKKD